MPIFATPNKSSIGPLLRQQGFTLVELLVVFGILALVTTIVPVAYDRMKESTQYRSTVRSLVVGLKSARSASLRGTESVFVVDLRRRVFKIDQGTDVDLPDSLQVRAVVAGNELSPEGAAAIRFFPTGGSTGGSIFIVRKSGQGVQIRVDWLSGRISQEKIEQ